MPEPLTLVKLNVMPSSRRTPAAVVARALEEYCATLQPGAQMPTYAELAQHFDASMRAIGTALSDLEKNGQITRRQGAGIFVADRPLAKSVAAGNGATGAPIVTSAMVNASTIVAVTKPDHSTFDRAMALLFGHVEAANLKLTCRFVNPARDTMVAPPEGEQPIGYICFRRDTLPIAKQLQAAGCRVVLIGTPPLDVEIGVPNVYGDQEHGGYLATKHLIELGHDRIAFCGDRNLMIGQRWHGYERALREARQSGREIHHEVIYQDEIRNWSANLDLAREYFSRPDRPTGLVEWNDHEAVTMISILSRIGLRVPEDIAVIGSDDMPEGRNIHPALTTIDTGIDQQLNTALKLLTRPIAPSPSHSVMVTPTLIRRESTAPLAPPSDRVLKP